MIQRRALVPNSLLALAKDSRYVSECQTLLLQVLSNWLPRRRHQLLEQESWILASLLCLALGLKQSIKGSTLGMEAVGLQFPPNSSRWKLVTWTLITLSWAYAFSPDRGERSNSDRTTISSSITASQSSQPNDELLRGSSRREFHEQQRRAMLRRARQAADNSSQPSISSSDSTVEPSVSMASISRREQWIKWIQQRFKTLVLRISQILAAAVLSPFEGPHNLIAEVQRHHQHHQGTIQKAGRWLAKLNLAHFCLSGNYPSWVHRFSGHSLVEDESSSNRLYHQPTTARIIGILLGAQVVATAVQASSSALSKWILHLEQQRQQSASLCPSSSLQLPRPAIVFQDDCESHCDEKKIIAANSICSICKMERTHPAASSSCGHVFCWQCLYQWVSAVRPECPLCRVACLPQDIMALYNYSPNR